MVSHIASAVIFVTLIQYGLQAEERMSSEKIIIHVPYKIHNHLHTHTNYKVIKVPEHNVESFPEAAEKEGEMKYLQKEIDSILSGTKLPNQFKAPEPQVESQIVHSLNDDQSFISLHSLHEAKESKIENLQGTHTKGLSEHVPTSSVRIPTIPPTFHTTASDYQYDEGNMYYHNYPTKSPYVPFYNAQIVHPTYQVEEQQASAELIPQQVPAYSTIGHLNSVSKPGKDLYFRNYVKKYPYSIRTGKYLPTTKAAELATKLYSVPTIATKTFAVPTTKSFAIPTTTIPKTLYKNNEEYEHIGFLVVGENSQKFVGVNKETDKV